MRPPDPIRPEPDPTTLLPPKPAIAAKPPLPTGGGVCPSSAPPPRSPPEGVQHRLHDGSTMELTAQVGWIWSHGGLRLHDQLRAFITGASVHQRLLYGTFIRTAAFNEDHLFIIVVIFLNTPLLTWTIRFIETVPQRVDGSSGMCE